MKAATEMSSTISSSARHSPFSRAGHGSMAMASKLKLMAVIGDIRHGNSVPGRAGTSLPTSSLSMPVGSPNR